MNGLISKGTEIEQIFFARSLPISFAIIAVVAIVLMSALLYRSERGLRTRWRIALGAIRIVLLLLVGVALLEPTAAIKQTRESKRSLAVLVDTSQSMSIRDQRKRPEDLKDAASALGFLTLEQQKAMRDDASPPNFSTQQRDEIAGATRLDLASRLLSGSASPLLDGLSDDLHIRYYGFGESLQMLGDADRDVNQALASISPSEPQTSLADSIREAADAYPAGSLAGIVVLSDGLETSNRQPEAIARDLGLRDIPLYILPTGIAEPDDVSIRNVIVQDVAFVGDTVPIKVQLRSSGYEKRLADLVVRFGGREVARQSVTLEGGLQPVDLYFDANVGTKGAALLEVVIEPFADEATAENNAITKSIRVVNEKINVLCIEGSARWEFRYLRAILKRDPRINATFIATRTGNELALHSSDYIARFPEDAEDAFQYDLVILGDVDSAFFTPGELARLEELIRDRGGSLLMLAGPNYSPSSYEGTAVENMLPVRFDPDAKWEQVDKTVHPVLTPEGRSSAVLTLETSRDKNDRIWSQLAPMDRLPPLLEPRAGATVLAALSDNGPRVDGYPLISWQRFGTGKCMFIASDRLWRLRFRTGDKYHWRVWSQCIQFLTLSRLMGEHKQIRMETDRVSYPIGDLVRIYAEVLDDGYEPVLRDGYDIDVRAVGEEASVPTRVNLRPDATRPGLYVGYYAPSEAGRYRIEVGEDDAERANTIEFQVADTSPEMVDTQMQAELLEKLARLSGGESFKLIQVGDLVNVIDTSRQQSIIRREVSLWDNWILAVVLIGLAGFEWFVRRKCDLL